MAQVELNVSAKTLFSCSSCMKFKPVSLKRKTCFSSTNCKRFFLIPFSIKLGPKFLLIFLYMLEAHKIFSTIVKPSLTFTANLQNNP